MVNDEANGFGVYIPLFDCEACAYRNKCSPSHKEEHMGLNKLLRQMKNQLEEEDVPVYLFDNQEDMYDALGIRKTTLVDVRTPGGSMITPKNIVVFGATQGEEGGKEEEEGEEVKLNVSITSLDMDLEVKIISELEDDGYSETLSQMGDMVKTMIACVTPNIPETSPTEGMYL